MHSSNGHFRTYNLALPNIDNWGEPPEAEVQGLEGKTVQRYWHCPPRIKKSSLKLAAHLRACLVAVPAPLGATQARHAGIGGKATMII